MASPLNSLPSELLHTIFSHLSISSLLTFAQTNQANYTLATTFITHLELAVLPKRIHSVLAFLEEECREDGGDEDEDNHVDRHLDEDDALDGQWSCSICSPSFRVNDYSRRHKINAELYRISRATLIASSAPTSPPTLISGHDRKMASQASGKSKASPLYLRERQFDAQNNYATEILTSRSIRQNLKSLILHLYTLHTPALAKALASLPSLLHLSLNFSHSYIYDTTLPGSYWRSTPAQGTGSPIWNSLAGIGEEASLNLLLRNLKSLTIRRAGVTSFQLRSWIKQNPNLTYLCFEKVRGVDLEFVNWLAGFVLTQRMVPDSAAVIHKIIFKDCSGLVCDRPEDLAWVDILARVDDGTGGDNVGNNGQHTVARKRTNGLAMLSLMDSVGVNESLFLEMLGFEDPEREETLADGYTTISHNQDNLFNYNSSKPDRSSIEDQSRTTPSSRINSRWTRGIQKIISPKGITILRGRRIISPHELRKQIYEARVLNMIGPGRSILSTTRHEPEDMDESSRLLDEAAFENEVESSDTVSGWEMDRSNIALTTPLPPATAMTNAIGNGTSIDPSGSSNSSGIPTRQRKHQNLTSHSTTNTYDNHDHNDDDDDNKTIESELRIDSNSYSQTIPTSSPTSHPTMPVRTRPTNNNQRSTSSETVANARYHDHHQQQHHNRAWGWGTANEIIEVDPDSF